MSGSSIADEENSFGRVLSFCLRVKFGSIRNLIKVKCDYWISKSLKNDIFLIKAMNLIKWLWKW